MVVQRTLQERDAETISILDERLYLLLKCAGWETLWCSKEKPRMCCGLENVGDLKININISLSHAVTKKMVTGWASCAEEGSGVEPVVADGLGGPPLEKVDE